MSAQPRVALVVGSGNVKCAAALGVWKVLARHGIAVDMLVGCAAGSIYAAGMAFGEEIAAIEDKSRSLWYDLMSDYATKLRAVLTGETSFTERSGLIDGSAAQARIAELYGEHTFAETQTLLHIVATDFVTGEPVVLSEGSVTDALHASVALPIIFPPHEVRGQLLTNGAVSNPMPADVAIKEGCDVILAMAFELPYPPVMRNFYAVQTHLNAVFVNNVLRSTCAFYNVAHHAEIISLQPAFEREIGDYDTGQVPYIIEQGERAAEAQVPYLQELLSADKD
jgi:NTE family protein